MIKKIEKITIERQVTLDGMMTFGMLENGLKTADFTCCEDVEMDAFSGTFKVQGMRDGNVYMTQKPKRVRNKAIFRDDNASLSLLARRGSAGAVARKTGASGKCDSAEGDSRTD